MRGAGIATCVVLMLAGCAAGPHIDTPPPAPRVVTLDRVVTEVDTPIYFEFGDAVGVIAA